MSEREDDEDIERLARERRLAGGYRRAARRALAFARRYREEEGAGGARERACVEQALAWRRAAHGLPVPSSHPGLARSRAAEAPADTRKTG